MAAVNENNSREAIKAQKKLKTDKKEQQQTVRKIRVRLIPIWLRVIIVSVLICLSAVTGAAVGYGVLGDGKASDIFKPSTWTHIVDLVEKK